MLMVAFISAWDIALSAVQVQPIPEMAEPFLKIVPDTADKD